MKKVVKLSRNICNKKTPTPLLCCTNEEHDYGKTEQNYYFENFNFKIHNLYFLLYMKNKRKYVKVWVWPTEWSSDSLNKRIASSAAPVAIMPSLSHSIIPMEWEYDSICICICVRDGVCGLKCYLDQWTEKIVRSW